jgi:DNA replication and repair protein RecF
MLSSLRLRSFRCFETLSCPLPVGTTVFTGDNAQGKTSILEAICVLLRLQSPRTGRTQELVKFGTSGFALAGTLEGRELRHFVEQEKRSLLVDEAPAKTTGEYLSASGLVVWMGNGDLELVSGSGEPRRRYLDFLGTQLFPDYRETLRDYEKALKARNFLLKRDSSPAWKQIDAYTIVLARHGELLRELRRSLVELLVPHGLLGQQKISGAAEQLALEYRPGAEGSLVEALEAAREEEMRRRVTATGPHRDDVLLSLNGLPAQQFASEGQQRTIALALKLAQATLMAEKRELNPILLLDDIFGELDPRRRNALLEALPQDSQRVITTTTLQWLDGCFVPEQVYRVGGGSVTV